MSKSAKLTTKPSYAIGSAEHIAAAAKVCNGFKPWLIFTDPVEAEACITRIRGKDARAARADKTGLFRPRSVMKMLIPDGTNTYGVFFLPVPPKH